MTKVLHIVPGFSYGGIESRLLDWYNCMDTSEVKFDIVKATHDDGNNKIAIALQELGAHVYTVPSIKLTDFMPHCFSMRKLMQNNYDCVHCHSPLYGAIDLQIAKLCGVKTRILHARTSSYGNGSRSIFIDRYMTRRAVRFATDRFACSDLAAKWAFGTEDNCVIIKNGTRTESFRFSDVLRTALRKQFGISDNFVVGFVGRFTEAKNIPFLIKAFANAYECNNDIRLVMAGDGPEFDDAKRIIDENGISNVVLMLGRSDNVNELLNAFDVLCLPSYYEGFPGVAIEAQANGLPCMISDRVTASVKINDNVSFLPIDKAELWSNMLLDTEHLVRVDNAIENVRSHGYDIATTAKWLEEFYHSKQ